MTPYLNLMPTTQSAPPPQKNTVSKDTSKSSSADDASLKADKDATSPDTDPSLFEELMASLLSMQAPAQTPVKTSPVASVTVGASASVSSAAPSAPQFGAAFNMDPALLVLPQDVSGQTLDTALIANSADSFSAELLAALTPGVPAPQPEVSSAPLPVKAPVAAPVAVPVPVIDSSAPTTASLTVSSDVLADPRLIACGLDPAQMEVLKDKIAAASASSTASAQTKIPAPANENGVITVSITPEKPVQPAPVAQNPTLVSTVVAMAQTTPKEVVVTAASEAGLSVDMVGDVDIDAAASMPVTADEGFDPVEFRIAQKFQRPVSTPSAAAPATVATPSTPTDAAPGAAKNPGASASAHAGASIEGKVTTDANLGSTLSASTTLSAGTTPSFDSMMVSPSALAATTAGVLTSPVIQNASASQSHPAVQAVAAVIAKNSKEGGAQTISMRLDPPELGKLQVQMKYKKGDPLKVHVVLEKADTASMFQRDAHALESALKDAGLQTDGSSLSFELAKDGNSFNQAMGQNSSGGQEKSSVSLAADDLPSIETSMDIFTDSKTGLTHYNLRV